MTHTDPTDIGLDQLREAQRLRERVRDQYQSLRESLQDDTPPDRNLERPESCWHCGYGLRGLETRGVCPECTKSVYGSRDGPFKAGLRWKRLSTVGVFLGAASLVLCMIAGPFSWPLGLPVLGFTTYVAFFADRGNMRYAYWRSHYYGFGVSLASVLIAALVFIMAIGI